MGTRSRSESDNCTSETGNPSPSLSRTDHACNRSSRPQPHKNDKGRLPAHQRGSQSNIHLNLLPSAYRRSGRFSRPLQKCRSNKPQSPAAPTREMSRLRQSGSHPWESSAECWIAKALEASSGLGVAAEVFDASKVNARVSYCQT